jgi:hypothetical protein
LRGQSGDNSESGSLTVKRFHSFHYFQYFSGTATTIMASSDYNPPTTPAQAIMGISAKSFSQLIRISIVALGAGMVVRAAVFALPNASGCGLRAAETEHATLKTTILVMESTYKRSVDLTKPSPSAVEEGKWGSKGEIGQDDDDADNNQDYLLGDDVAEDDDEQEGQQQQDDGDLPVVDNELVDDEDGSDDDDDDDEQGDDDRQDDDGESATDDYPDDGGIDGDDAQDADELTTFVDDDDDNVKKSAVPKTVVHNLHFCTVPMIGDVHSDNATEKIDIWYQCEGRAYRKFASYMHAYVENYVKIGKRPPEWGRRPHALPDGSSVLIFGNSHSRQIAHALACQHAESIVSVERHETHMVDKDMVHKIQFDNDSALWIVANSYAAYSKDHWKTLVETQVGQPLDAFDSIIMGPFNGGGGRVSAFSINMDIMTDELPDEYGIDIAKFGGPHLEDLAAVYDKPILFHGMLSFARKAGKHEEMLQAANVVASGRQNVRYFGSRKQMREMEAFAGKGVELEGGATSKLEVSKAVNKREFGKSLHRCTGKNGGHPDLVAWEVTEWLLKMNKGASKSKQELL